MTRHVQFADSRVPFIDFGDPRNGVEAFETETELARGIAERWEIPSAHAERMASVVWLGMSVQMSTHPSDQFAYLSVQPMDFPDALPAPTRARVLS